MKKAKSTDSKNGVHSNDAVLKRAASDDPNALPLIAANLSHKKATPPHPPRKLRIKFLKDKPTLPPNFEEDTWEQLRSAICAIFLKQPDSCDLEKLYQLIRVLWELYSCP
ncbi:hypothetical protein VNO78_11131 [Psophocarpus tetragonolobus]|uniref:Uncharacterized protein n=1 Tax=Psophocarpus tetragonolobus TaxID=3891 RepID=A0AAN9ST19_PSOTE